jgi:alpha-tubulin suppressor-like RCC1 family protein
MSIRQMFPGSIVKPGFNPLAAQTTTTTYYPYLYGWGQNVVGQLGLGNTTSYSSPTQIGSLTDWSSIACGLSCTLSIKNDGTLWAWGQNTNGQLGLSNLTNYSSPKQVGALTNWRQVSSGINSNTAAIKTDGTLWAWGYNNLGSLGFGNTTRYSSPKQVGALTNWSVVSVNGTDGNTLAVKTDGTLWAWGDNTYGQLGLGNTTNYSSPKQVGALTNWLSVASGNVSSIATKTDGTLWAWGNNGNGQLGTSNTTAYSSPKQVGALTTWNYINTGWETSAMAIKTDGTLWSWGQNSIGQLGLGNTTYYSSPKQVGALTNWLIIAGGFAGSSVSVKTDGTLWSWGRNNNGQLGLGNTTSYSSPKQVGSITTWLKVACGRYHTESLLY